MNAIVALSDTSYMIPYSDFKIINWTLKKIRIFFTEKVREFMFVSFLQGFRTSLVKDEFANKITEVRYDAIWRVFQVLFLSLCTFF